MEDDKRFKNLVNFLKYFINRPNHLARYLIDNDALDVKFLNGLVNANTNKSFEQNVNIYFLDINQMNNYFKSLVDKKTKISDVNDLRAELTKELNICLTEERYEDAIRIRDYLKKLTKDLN